MHHGCRDAFYACLCNPLSPSFVIRPASGEGSPIRGRRGRWLGVLDGVLGGAHIH